MLPPTVRSIRFRIAAPTALLVLVLLTLLSYLLVDSVQVRLLSQVDADLTNGAHYVEQQLGHKDALPTVGPKGTFGQFLLANGKLLGESADLKGSPALIDVLPVGTDPVLSTITTRQFGELRVLAVRLGGPLAPILVEAQQINQINDATRSLTVRVAIGTPLLALAFGVLTWFVVGRAMKPVESTRLAVAGIVDLESGERVENPRTGDELESLVSTMNLLLDRLQVSVEHEQRFISDASHELRSPIAAVRAILESGDPSVAGSWDSKLAALGALQRLQDLADQLLVLDRTAESRREILRQPVDVDEWVFAVAEQLRGTTNLTIDTTSVSGGQVLATEVDVIRIVDNLMANAARYAQRTVKLSLVEQDGWVRFEVTDDGPGIPAEKQMEIFERFTRLDTDRGQNTGGAGLGLAIVRDLIDRYRGSVEVTSQNGSGATFVVMLPSSRASA